MVLMEPWRKSDGANGPDGGSEGEEKNSLPNSNLDTGSKGIIKFCNSLG